MSRIISAGIDGGSRAIKIVVMDAISGEVLASGVRDQGVDHDGLATGLFDELLGQADLRPEQVERVIATGYTRNRIHLAQSTVTEITCHAWGVRRQVPGAMTIIEIGGQDSKLLRLEPPRSGSGVPPLAQSRDGSATLDPHRDGSATVVRDFAMNDRCAAGTGRFLEVVVGRLGTSLAEAGQLARASVKPAPVSSTCVVFAESEIIGLLASGTAREDILAGVQTAMAQRIAAMAGRSLDEPVIFTGGVALVSGMAEALGAALGCRVRVAPDPQMTGALGAAILAARQVVAP